MDHIYRFSCIYRFYRFSKRSNNVTISLNVLYAKKEKKLHPAYVSKDNSDHEKLVIYLMTPNGEGWHYLAVKKLSAL